MIREFKRQALEDMLTSIRPDKAILAYRWVEFQEEMTWLEVLQSLRKGRYQRWGRWFFNITLLAMLMTWIVAKSYIDVVAIIAAILGGVMLIYRWFIKDIELNSVVIFYDDKASIIQNVALSRPALNPHYEIRRDVTKGTIARKFLLRGVNPFWHIGNLSVKLRSKWIILSMQAGWLSRPRRFQQKIFQDKSITFADMKRRLLAFQADQCSG